MWRQARIERQAARGPQHRGGGAGETGAILFPAQRTGAARDFEGIGPGAGQQGGEQQRVVAGERGRGLAEQAQRGRTDALGLAAKAGQVEIGLEDLVLGPARLQRPGRAHLAQLFAHAPAAGHGEIGREIGGNLHRQRRGAAPALALDAVP